MIIGAIQEKEGANHPKEETIIIDHDHHHQLAEMINPGTMVEAARVEETGDEKTDIKTRKTKFTHISKRKEKTTQANKVTRPFGTAFSG